MIEIQYGDLLGNTHQTETVTEGNFQQAVETATNWVNALNEYGHRRNRACHVIETSDKDGDTIHYRRILPSK